MKQHRFLLYPAGAPGVGLLILRISVSIFLLSYPIDSFPTISFATAAMIILACLTGLGLRTRSVACGTMAVVGLICITDQAAISVGLVAHALDAIVLAICGPGAFSLDARLFGRATVHLPG